MPLEDPTSIDVIYKTANGKPFLAITDAGITTDPEERLNLFVQKLRGYVGAIMSQEFRRDFPGVSPKDFTIEYVYKNEPTDRMLKIKQVAPSGDRVNVIPVVFHEFSPDTQTSPIGQANPPPEVTNRIEEVRNSALMLCALTVSQGLHKWMALSAIGGKQETHFFDEVTSLEEFLASAQQLAVQLTKGTTIFVTVFADKLEVNAKLVDVIRAECHERGSAYGMVYARQYHPKSLFKKFDLIGEVMELGSCDNWLA